MIMVMVNVSVRVSVNVMSSVRVKDMVCDG